MDTLYNMTYEKCFLSTFNIIHIEIPKKQYTFTLIFQIAQRLFAHDVYLPLETTCINIFAKIISCDAFNKNVPIVLSKDP